MTLFDKRSSEISNYFLNLYKIKNASDILGFESVTNEKPKWYHQLPRNILLNVFKYFSENELQIKIIPVLITNYLFVGIFKGIKNYRCVDNGSTQLWILLYGKH